MPLRCSTSNYFTGITVRKKISKFIVATLTLVTTAGCSVFGIESVEEASYRVELKDNQFEIRNYDALVVAEARVNESSSRKAGNKAFRTLFKYISGENEGSQKISMTAPVLTDQENEADDQSGDKIAMTAPVIYELDGNTWRYSFVLPKNYELNTAPTPLDPNITLSEIPQRRVASIRFSGRATDRARQTGHV